MKTLVKADSLVPFLNQKNKSDVKFRTEAIIERKETFVTKVESINEEDGTVECIITTQGVDRAGDVIISSGIDTSEFKKINSVFINHDYSLLPIATCEELVHKNGHITAKIKFALNVALSKDAFELVKAGALRGVSVGFDATEVILKGTRSFDQMTKDFQIDNRANRIISKWKLYEFSLVSVPCNAECMVKSMDVKEVEEEKVEDKPEEVEKKEDTNEGLSEGTKIEMEEHAEVVNYLREKGINVDEVFSMISAAHLKEDPNYYKDQETEKETETETETPEQEEEEHKDGMTEDNSPLVQPVLAEDEVKSVEIVEIKKDIKEEIVIEVEKPIKHVVKVLKTPAETDEFIKKCVEARLRGKIRI